MRNSGSDLSSLLSLYFDRKWTQLISLLTIYILHVCITVFLNLNTCMSYILHRNPKHWQWSFLITNNMQIKIRRLWMQKHVSPMYAQVHTCMMSFLNIKFHNNCSINVWSFIKIKCVVLTLSFMRIFKVQRGINPTKMRGYKFRGNMDF